MTRVAAARRRRLPGLLAASLVAIAAHAAGPAEQGRARATATDGVTARPQGPGITVTVALAMRDPAGAVELLKTLLTPGDPQYGRFLSRDEFIARFAPDEVTVRRLVTGLRRRGLEASRSGATTLRVTGTQAAIERSFGVSLAEHAVPARGAAPGYAFRAPLARGRVPVELAGLVTAVEGLDTRPSLHPHVVRLPQHIQRRPTVMAGSSTGNPFGSLTVADFASLYDVQPLYDAGISGAGRTIGILTFAGFTPSDAFAYWSAVGLNVDPQRLTIVDVDGGPGAPSDAAGSDETTLDVEQAGGVAPGAKLMLYQAPNTNQGFIDVFAQAIDDDVADTLSISWGFWEWFSSAAASSVTDPSTGQTVGVARAVHELLIRAALQGQTVFTAAGDGGAYEVNRDLNCYGPESPAVAQSCSLTLSVGYPATDTAITAAGGTTLPGSQQYCLDSSCSGATVTVDIPDERAWGWDYLSDYCVQTGYPDPVACGIFGVGGGGGVSTLFALPPYQAGVHGLRTTPAQQTLMSGTYYVQNNGLPPVYALPGGFPGRNVPDVSANADPNTGYEIYYTSSAAGSTLSVDPSYGGTSFVSPQLSGVAALLGETLKGRRLGLLTPALYRAALGRHVTGAAIPVVRPIVDGDNWFYASHAGYNQATGLGVLDVARFATFLGAGY